MSVLFEIHGIKTAYDSLPVLQGITFSIEKGDFVGIVGPNGSGKSTLIKNMAKVLPYQAGRVFFMDKELEKYRQKEFAKKLSVVSQEHPAEIAYSVYDVVMMGRTPHWGFFQKETVADEVIVEQALKLAGISHLKKRLVSELSGGEKQRVFIAQAIAQKPEILLLDEPTTHLDIHYQVEIMDVINKLNEDQNLTILVVLHDLNLASQYCDKVIMLDQGCIAAMGTPQEVITASNISKVYNCEVTISSHPITQTPFVALHPKINNRNFSRDQNRSVVIHIVAGGGSGFEYFNIFKRYGYAVTAGVLNMGDSDWIEAQKNNIELVEEEPFSPITDTKKRENIILAAQSDLIVLTDVPFGRGNIENARTVAELAEKGKTVLVVNQDSLKERDYSGGIASSCLESIKGLANVYLCSKKDTIDTVNGILKEGEGHEKEARRRDDSGLYG